jgi:hypothetical protein
LAFGGWGARDWSSANGKVTLSMQTDGNLVIRSNGGPAVWASGTPNHPDAKLNFQSDGNLVIRDASGKAVWASNSNGKKGSTLVLQNDCNLVMADDSGAVVWSTGKTCVAKRLAVSVRCTNDNFYDTGSANYCVRQATDSSVTQAADVATPEHRDQADEDSNVGAIAGGASALVALIAIGAAIRMRRHRTLQASESPNTDMHQNPGVEDANAVPAVADPADAI